MNQASRKERQAQRLRGAGRVLVDAAPAIFKARLTTKTSVVRKSPIKSNNVIRDVLVPISASVRNTPARKERKTSKVMDFRTPKSARKSFGKGKTPAEEAPRIALLAPVNDATLIPASVESTEDNVLIIAGSAMLSTQADENNDHGLCDGDAGLVIDTDDATMQIEVQDTPQPTRDDRQQVSTVVDARTLSTPATTRKRKRQDRDIEVPLKMTPELKVKKKARGLLRELGPGASRFLIGAPNFATPARRQSIRITKIVLNQPRQTSRRTSLRLDLAKDDAMIKTKTALKKVIKSCKTCLGIKAWRKWHSTGDDEWLCHKCHTADSSASTATQTKTTRAKKTAYSLTTDELKLVYTRRQAGVTFNAIAVELGKWKSGTSVKNYLARHVTPEGEALYMSSAASELPALTAAAVHRKPTKTRVAKSASTKTSKPLRGRSIESVEDCDF